MIRAMHVLITAHGLYSICAWYKSFISAASMRLNCFLFTRDSFISFCPNGFKFAIPDPRSSRTWSYTAPCSLSDFFLTSVASPAAAVQ